MEPNLPKAAAAERARRTAALISALRGDPKPSRLPTPHRDTDRPFRAFLASLGVPL
jgi:hypothetical protein